ncbi:MAG: hypothetical protein GY909_07895 [Oligoflexia bacterium]|nr:hypothetical protein [Oligoflexia bacterium]
MWSIKKKMKTLLKVTTVHTSVFFLLVSPVSIYAKDDDDKNDSVSGGQIALGIMNQVGGAVIQGYQQNLARMQAQQQMGGLQPQLFPSKFFPACGMPKAVTDYPANACQAPANPQDMVGMQTQAQFKQLAYSHENFYENLLAVGQNSRAPQGIECLKANSKQALSQFQSKINALQQLQDKIKKETQVFRDQNKRLLEEMDSEASELYGETGRDLKANTKKMHDYFSPQCQRVLGNANLTSAPRSGGLLGLRDNTLAPSKEKANDIKNNEGKLRADLDYQLKEIKKQIEQDGVEAWQFNPGEIVGRGRNPFLGMQQTLKSEKDKFDREVSRIRKIVQEEVGYRLPPLDSNFRYNMKSFSRNAKQFFRKKEINECVTMSGSGVGLDVNKVLEGLRQESTNSEGTTVIAYRKSLKNILESDAFIEEKLEAIRRLDAKFGPGVITVRYSDASANQIQETPYGLFRKQVQMCENYISQDNTYSKNNTNQKSIAEKIDRADRYIKKIMGLEKSFSSNLVNSIRDQVENCNGQPMEAGACVAGSDKMMNPKSQSFCIAHATTCADQVNNCYQQVEQVVAQKEQKIKTLGANWDRNVTALVARQEQILQSVKAQVTRDAEFIRRFIPGSEYAFPKDLFVPMPEDKKHPKFGILMKGGGDLKEIENLPKKLEELKGMLAQQAKAVEKELNQYIADQEKAVQDNMKRWSKIAKDCEKAEKGSQKMAADQYKAQQDEYGKAAQFCKKYNMLRENPGAGCGQAKSLAEDVMEASSYVNPNVGPVALQYDKYCKSVNNEGDDSSESPSNDDFVLNFKDACEGAGDNWNEARSDIVGDIVDRFEDDISSSDKDVIEGILAGSKSTSDLSSDFRSSQVYRKYLRKVLSPSTISVSPFELPATLPSGATAATYSDYVNALSNYQSSSDKGLCQAYKAKLARNVLEACTKEGLSGTVSNCINSEKDKELSDTAFVSVGRAIASIDNIPTSSASGKIGEAFEDTPCMAQMQTGGRNGLDSFDAGILGEDAMDFLRSGSFAR